MREAKPEEGSVAFNFSSRLDEEAPPCGVGGGMVAGWRACRHAFVMEIGPGPEGSRLTVNVGARRIVVWRKTLRAWLMATVSTEGVPAQTFSWKEKVYQKNLLKRFAKRTTTLAAKKFVQMFFSS
jgi:hypothetical protein